MPSPDHEQRILPINEVWPGIQLKTVRSSQNPRCELVMMQLYKFGEEDPVKSGFFVLQPGEVEPAPKARRLDLPLSTRFEPVEIYTVDSLPKKGQFAVFAEGKGLRYRGSIGHNVCVASGENGLSFIDYEWDMAYPGSGLMQVDNVIEGDKPKPIFTYKLPENAFFVPVHRKQMP